MIGYLIRAWRIGRWKEYYKSKLMAIGEGIHRSLLVASASGTGSDVTSFYRDMVPDSAEAARILETWIAYVKSVTVDCVKRHERAIAREMEGIESLQEERADIEEQWQTYQRQKIDDLAHTIGLDARPPSDSEINEESSHPAEAALPPALSPLSELSKKEAQLKKDDVDVKAAEKEDRINQLKKWRLSATVLGLFGIETLLLVSTLVINQLGEAAPLFSMSPKILLFWFVSGVMSFAYSYSIKIWDPWGQFKAENVPPQFNFVAPLFVLIVTVAVAITRFSIFLSTEGSTFFKARDIGVQVFLIFATPSAAFIMALAYQSLLNFCNKNELHSKSVQAARTAREKRHIDHEQEKQHLKEQLDNQDRYNREQIERQVRLEAESRELIAGSAQELERIRADKKRQMSEAEARYDALVAAASEDVLQQKDLLGMVDTLALRLAHITVTGTTASVTFNKALPLSGE